MTDMRVRSAARTVVVSGAVLLWVGGCGAPAPVLPVAEPSTASSVTASAAPSTTALPTSAAPQLTRVEARYAGGQIVGGLSTTPVALGSTVELVVTSDVADEVHVHGYEKKADVPGGGTATVRFVADVAGTFEIELENNGVQLTRLQVR